MTLHKLAAGSGYTYLTRQVAAHDATERHQSGLTAYYEEKGESPGRWVGTGLVGLELKAGDVVTEEQMRLLFGQGWHPRSSEPGAVVRGWGALGRPFPVFAATTFRQEVAQAFSDHNTLAGRVWNAPTPAEERAWIRTRVATDVFERQHGRPPRDETELTGFLASASRPAQVPVAGYDLTFSPVKSVSALWAIAPPRIAQEVEAAHGAAVRSTVELLEREVAFTRVGKAGIRQVPVTGLVAAAFEHRDSRAGDPDLHTHLVVSNKVQTLPRDGSKWLTLDGRMIFKAKVTASEHYNTRIEAELTHRLGVRFTDREATDGRRPVREIDGLDPRLLAAWSSRRADITTRQRDLAATFLTDHGRTPTRVEAAALAQQANLETRPDKHEPRSLSDQRRAWLAEAEQVLAGPGPRGTSSVSLMAAALVPGTYVPPARSARYDTPNDLARRVLSTLEGSRSTWQVWHVRAETLRQARYANISLSDLDATVNQVVDQVLHRLSLPVRTAPDLSEPDLLRRAGGESVYSVHGADVYTSAGIVTAEQRLLEAAGREDGYAVQDIFVQLATVETRQHGTPLDDGQVDLVTRLATSGARVQVALAPAGSGKTTAMTVLARAWRAGGGTILGFAPTAVAAHELAQAIETPAETIAKYLRTIGQGADVVAFPPVGSRTLVVVDEAGMVGTKDLAALVDHVLERGGSVRLVGDDQQLTAVAASGILRDLAEAGDRAGTTIRLTALHRFTDPNEAAANLGIRRGDPDALSFYLANGRVHLGAADQAYQAWRSDLTDGRTSLLLAATRDTVQGVNERARADRLAATDTAPDREVVLADGTHASAGDLVITRRNDRGLHASDGSWVKNGDRWTVRTVEANGDLVLEAAGRRRRFTNACVRVPAEYAQTNLRLGYAATIHSAQGATVDTTHTVLAGTENRQSLYVALTRGRDANHVYLDQHLTAADESALEPTLDDTPRQVLTNILQRDDRAVSAIRAGTPNPGHDLIAAVQHYEDALPLLAQHTLGPERLTALDTALEDWMPGITSHPGYAALRGQIALRWVDGQNPDETLRRATWWLDKTEIATLDDPAAGLAQHVNRIPASGEETGPLPWLPPIPAGLTGDPTVQQYLQRLSARIRALDQSVPGDGTTSVETERLDVSLETQRRLGPHPSGDVRPTGYRR